MLTDEVIWNAAEEGCAACVRTAAGDGGESEAGVQRERGRSRGATALPEVETEARLSLLPARGDVTELTEAILYSADGVERAWAVSVDGVELGRAGDISALSESLEDIIGTQIPHAAVSAGFDTDIAIRAVAIPEGTESDLTELTAAIRGLARVYYVTPDGAQRYA